VAIIQNDFFSAGMGVRNLEKFIILKKKKKKKKKERKKNFSKRHTITTINQQVLASIKLDCFIH